jgi:hypothetical protein
MKIRVLPIARYLILCFNAAVECKSISFLTPPVEGNGGKHHSPLFLTG